MAKVAYDEYRSALSATPCTQCRFLDACRETVLATFDDPFCWPESPRNGEFVAYYKGDMPNHLSWSANKIIDKNEQLSGIYAGA